MTIQEKTAALRSMTADFTQAIDTDAVALGATVKQLETTKATLETEIARLKAIIDGGQPPPPPPPPPPTGTRPKILDEKFDKPLDMDIFYLDKTSSDRVVVSGGRCLFKWERTADTNDLRAQMVMKHTVGGGGTPRRDPIGSERFYAFGLYLPTEYSFDIDGNSKCVTGQVHQGNQGGIVNPPFSFEQIKTSADGEVMRGVLSLVGMERKVWNIGLPPRHESKILVHVKWSAGPDGFLKVYRDGALTPIDHKGPTCNPRTLNGETTQDLNPSIGSYNPGRPGGKRWVVYTGWAIGSEENTLQDMLA